jgi:hypothetical protein
MIRAFSSDWSPLIHVRTTVSGAPTSIAAIAAF